MFFRAKRRPEPVNIKDSKPDTNTLALSLPNSQEPNGALQGSPEPRVRSLQVKFPGRIFVFEDFALYHRGFPTIQLIAMYLASTVKSVAIKSDIEWERNAIDVYPLLIDAYKAGINDFIDLLNEARDNPVDLEHVADKLWLRKQTDKWHSFDSLPDNGTNIEVLSKKMMIGTIKADPDQQDYIKKHYLGWRYPARGY